MDGTNACIVIQDNIIVGIQSRKRFITIGHDNFGFAGWVENHKEELLSLGEGYHYGEWVGPGIQKNPHKLDQKTFFLFNSMRRNDENPNRPDCCNVVSILYHGDFYEDILGHVMDELQNNAKEANYTPEGVIVYSHTTRNYTKTTFKNSNGKWNVK